MARVTLVSTGFCTADINPAGPVQLYVAPGTVVAVRFMVWPTHSGPEFPAVTGHKEQDAGAA